MATLQITTNYVSSISKSKQSTWSSFSSHPRFRACSDLQTDPTNIRRTSISLPKLMKPASRMMINYKSDQEEPAATTSTTARQRDSSMTWNKKRELLIAQLYAIAEAAADRAEMHDIIGKQRDNWNHLFLHSINSITLTASVAAGIAEMMVQSNSPNHLQLAFKLSSALLFAASTAMMAVTSKIQPSQLAEEQRNATRLFRQIDNSIHTLLALTPTEADVKVAMERVLALDKAYPLPLLPGMLDKFPNKLEPTVWWPNLFNNTSSSSSNLTRGGGGGGGGNDTIINGWSKGLEHEMEGVVAKVRSKDIEQYVHFGNKVLAINKVVAVAGPVLSGLAAIGASMVGVMNGTLGPFPVLFAVVGGALAAVVNTLQHGGQAGTVIELSRNCAGFYKNLGEEIESNLREGEVEKREDGELFRLRVALKLGRSLSELQGFGRSVDGAAEDNIGEFAGKLF